MTRTNYYNFINNSVLISQLKDEFQYKLNLNRSKHVRFNDDIIWSQITGVVFDLFSQLINFELELIKDHDVSSHFSEKTAYFYSVISTDEKWQSEFFKTYPVFSTLLKSKLLNISNFILEILNNLGKDLIELKNHGFEINSELTNLKFCSGDLHNDKCTVMLQFSNSKKIYYKPRNLAPELLIQELITSNFEVIVGRTILKRVRTLNKGEYGYSEHVENEGCQNLTEVKDYYFNIGCLSAFCYLLGIQDIICDNVIAHKSQVALIDLECVLTPYKAPNDSIVLHKKSYADLFFSTSLYHSGIIPRLTSTDFENPYSNDSCLIYQKESFKHLPKIKNTSFDAKRFCHDFTQGFVFGYNSIKANKFFTIDVIKEIENCEITGRYLEKPTIFYNKMLMHLLHPISLTSNSNFNNSLKDLIKTHELTTKEEVLQAEIKQLQNIDIPYFCTTPTSRSIYDNKGNEIKREYFEFTGLEMLKHRISSLNEQNLHRHLEIINNSFLTHFNFKEADSKVNVKIKEDYLTINNKKELDLVVVKTEINRIADYIISKSYDDNNPSWIDINLNSFEIYEQSILPPGLAHGTDGISIFLGLAGDFCENDGFKKTSKSIIEKNIDVFLNFKLFKALNQNFTSPYLFPLSTVYATLYLRNIIDINKEVIEALIDKYFEYTYLFYANINNNCLLNGVAGNVNLLYSINKIYQDERCIKLAEEIGTYLMKISHSNSRLAKWKTKEGYYLTGYSHGTASYANSLILIYQITQNEKFLKHALKAIQFDMNSYNKHIGEFYDYRYKPEVRFASTWAHGSAGIGLSHIINNQFGVNLTESILERCRTSILKNPKLNNHTLMNGFWGNLEILRGLENSISLKIHDFEQIVFQIIESKKAETWISGLPFNNESLSTLNGICGVGYSIIRQFNWKNTPSILCLEINNGLLIDNLHK